MKSLKYLFSLIVISLAFNGCMGQPSIPIISEQESMIYIDNFNKQYENIKRDSKDETIIKWIQPFNKKDKCEIEVNFGENNKTLDGNYRLLWDGECKNGKAEGLGRVFEISDVYEQSLLSIYSSGKISNVCFIKRKYENTTLMGECRGNELDFDFDFSKLVIIEIGEANGTKNDFKKIKNFKPMNSSIPTYNIITKIYEDLNQFNIEQKVGTYGNIDTPIMIMQISPFSNESVFQKIYPNYGYLLSENFYGTYNDKDQAHGHIIPEYKDGAFGVEVVNDKPLRELYYPNSIIKFYTDEYNSVKSSVEKANDAYAKANIIKEKYKNKICKDSVKVDFIDNDEYKAICNENERFAQLKTKIDAKLAQIEQQKQVRREQQNQQRMIQSQQTQAAAAIMSANAQQQANTNQSLQNLNNNLQMQQLNNNLMMNNLMPKRYDVYVH